MRDRDDNDSANGADAEREKREDRIGKRKCRPCS